MQTCVQYGRQVSNNNTSTTGAMRVREFVTSVLKTSSARGLFLRNPRLRRHLGASVLTARLKQKTTVEGAFKTHKVIKPGTKQPRGPLVSSAFIRSQLEASGCPILGWSQRGQCPTIRLQEKIKRTRSNTIIRLWLGYRQLCRRLALGRSSIGVARAQGRSDLCTICHAWDTTIAPKFSE